ncbi:MAG: DUF2520 domain-containing protein [Planctomycetota bacterium]|nr:DUF2520 domain-containing protein [Planctomycetota bacterium]
MTKVCIIGLGRVGSVLSLAHKNAHDELCESANTVIFAVPDDKLVEAITDFLASNNCKDKFVVHVSGVHGLEVLKPISDAGAQVAALHPIMQFVGAETDVELLKQSYVSCSADQSAHGKASALVEVWGAKMISLNSDVDRRQYHLALSLVSNHITGLMAWANELLVPALGEHSSEAVAQMAARAVAAASCDDPLSSLTGPVARGDANTIAQHMQSLDEQQQLRYAGLLLNLQALVDERRDV